MTDDNNEDPESNLYEWEKANLPKVVREEIKMFEKERENLQIRLDETRKQLNFERVKYKNLVRRVKLTLREVDEH